VPSVKVLQTEGSRRLLELAPGTDNQAVLTAALATGPVREFAPYVPSLSELFRHLVTEESQS
jgi:ABC-2 type transport system ATP-binding protein